MSFHSTNQVKVGLSFGDEFHSVGRLARRDGIVYFEYSASFLDSGLEISPLNCPLRSGLQTFDPHLFEGLPGVFYDSLPDGWGRLLLDRKMRSEGVMPEQISPLDRLVQVENSGMGALVYEPNNTGDSTLGNMSLDKLADNADKILRGEASDVLQEMILLNGSSAGARPKAMIGVNLDTQDIVYGKYSLKEGFEPWLVKFPNTSDGPDAGAIEYVYALMATNAGIDMEKVHLFPAEKAAGRFATKRFDRDREKRLHIHSACGLLHSDFRTPYLDYEDLITLTLIMTKDIREAEKMFRLAVFNVLAYNRDDHGKNFSFLMDSSGQWKLAPAYDLTFSSGPGGEQSTMVMGEGRTPTTTNLVKLGLEAKLPRKSIDSAIEQTKAALDQWRELASQFAVTRENIALIASKMGAVNT